MMMRTLCVLNVLFLSATAFAQLQPQSGRVSGVIRSAPRDLQRYVDAAEEAIADERYAEAVTYLGGLMTQEVVNDTVNQDYFIIDKESGKVTTQLRQRVQDLIGSMPREGRELYELTFGSDARAKLKVALETASVTELQQIVREYFHTKAGYEACMILGRFQISRGRPLGAALLLERLLRSPARTLYDPQLSLLVAAAWRYANQPDKSKEILKSLCERYEGNEVRIGGQPVKLPAPTDDLVKWLDDTLDTNEPLVRRAPTSWTMFMGAPDRNGHSEGSAPLPSMQWFLRSAIELDDEKIIEEHARKFERAELPAITVLQPLVVEDYVLMRTAKRLFGINMVTGKRVWVYPWEQSNYERAQQDNRNIAAKTQDAMKKQQLLHRMWQDIPYGHLSSNGKDVYVLNGLGLHSQQQSSVGVFNGMRVSNPAQPKDYNELVSLQLIDEEGKNVEGKTRWRIGGINGVDEPKLAGAFFMSTPVAQDGKLYTIAEINGQLELVVLGENTGALIWKQQLAQIDGLRIDQDVKRRLFGAIPSLVDGVLICPTNAGAIVAVDLANQSLLWGYRYKTTQPAQRVINGRVIISSNRVAPVPEIGKYWLDGAARIADGRVVITPSDSSLLHCLDFLTGEEAWKPIERGDALYVGCIHGGNIILVERQKVRAISLATGKTAWQAPLSDMGAGSDGEGAKSYMPCGRGMRSKNLYYLPVAGLGSSKLFTIDLEKGKIVHEAETHRRLGNLVGYKDTIISQDAERLTRFYRIDPLRELVEKRLEDNPENVEFLTLQAELLSFDNKQADAIEVLRKAYELEPESDRARDLLARTVLLALRTEFKDTVAVATELETVISQPEQRSEYLRQMTRGYAELGELEKSFSAFLKLASHERRNARLLNEPDALVRRGPRLEVRSDRWIQGRFNELCAKAKDETLTRIDKEIDAELQRALAADSPAGLAKFIDYFGSHSYGDLARLKLAELLTKDSSTSIEAELLLQKMAGNDEEKIAGPATALLASFLLKQNYEALAARQYQRLKDEFADVDCGEGKLGQALYDEANKNAALQKHLSGEYAQWKTGQVKTEPTSQRGIRLPSYYRLYPIRITEQRGVLQDGVRLIYDHQGNRMFVRSPYGEQIAEVSLQRPDRRRIYTGNYHLTHAKINGHVVVLSLGYELIGIDLLKKSDAILWRKPLVAALPSGRSVSFRINQRPIQTPFGLPYYMPTNNDKLVGQIGPLNMNGVTYQVDSTVTSIDPLTGKSIWRRTTVPKGCRLFGDSDHVILYSADLAKVQVLNAHDGTLKTEVERDDSYKIWATWKNCILEWKTLENNVNQLRAFDYAAGEELWSRELPSGTKASLVGVGDELVIMQTDGEFEILSLESSRRQLAGFVDDQKSLISVHAMRSKDQYILLVNRPAISNSTDSVQAVPSGTSTPLVNVKIYGFDRRTGRSQWESPAVVEHFGFPLEQSPESPVLVFLRHRTPRSGSPRKQYSSIACIDKRDGSLVFKDDKISSTTHFYHLEALPDKQELYVNLPNKAFRLRFTEDPAPPAPPAQVMAKIPPKSNGGLIDRSIKAIFGDDPFSAKDLFDN